MHHGKPVLPHNSMPSLVISCRSLNLCSVFDVEIYLSLDALIPQFSIGDYVLTYTPIWRAVAFEPYFGHDIHDHSYLIVLCYTIVLFSWRLSLSSQAPLVSALAADPSI
jgi:hypothetical protein